MYRFVWSFLGNVLSDLKDSMVSGSNFLNGVCLEATQDVRCGMICLEYLGILVQEDFNCQVCCPRSDLGYRQAPPGASDF
jgi:hypothetical protein